MKIEKEIKVFEVDYKVAVGKDTAYIFAEDIFKATEVAQRAGKQINKIEEVELV